MKIVHIISIETSKTEITAVIEKKMKTHQIMAHLVRPVHAQDPGRGLTMNQKGQIDQHQSLTDKNKSMRKIMDMAILALERLLFRAFHPEL